MPTLNHVFVVEWKVDGAPRTVQFVKATPHLSYVQDGATTNDTQTIIAYINNQKDEDEKKRLLNLVALGLITLATASSVRLTIPPVPSP